MDASAYKVRIVGPNEQTVIFQASAPLGESRSVEYDGYNIVHLPTTLLSYHRTSSRQFHVTGKLVSRTEDEANENVRYLDYIRSWALPDFGGTGATPPILTLYAYGNTNINGRRVVLRSYEWTFPDEVDYVWSGDQPMPVIGMLSVALEEAYSAEEVTAQAWKISVNTSQVITTTEKKVPYLSDSFELTNGDGWWVQNGPTGPTATAPNPYASVMSSLASNSSSSNPLSTPGVLAGTLARTLSTAALNSPLIKEVTGKLPPVLTNIFVGGASIAIGQAGKAVTTTVSSVTQPSAVSGFGRTTDLPAPGPVGG